MSLELFLFAAVMEVIVIGTFFGGGFMAYCVGQGQSGAAPEPAEARTAAAPQHAGVSGSPTDMEDRGPAA